MKKILTILTCSIAVALCAVAQEATDVVDIMTADSLQLEILTPVDPDQETPQEVKERKKRQRELNDDLDHARALNSLRRGYFVLMADNIQIGNTGYRHYDINSNSNFILVQGVDGIIQFALNTGFSGTNGLGGWTGKGTVRNKRLTVNDNGDVFMQFAVVSSTVNADVTITLYPGSKRAVAHINGGVPITMHGEILPYRDRDHR